MNGLTSSTTVLWYGPNPPTSIPQEIAGWELRPWSEETVREANLIVVESSAFSSFHDCRRFCFEQALPVLWLTDPQQLSEAVQSLLEKDDVGLLGSPLSLIAARLCKMRSAQLHLIDPLTGVQRREALFAYLRSWAMMDQRCLPLSLIVADLDHFKALNDRWGVNAGDEALQRFGHSLRTLCESSPLIARSGGQEFSVIIHDDEPQAEKLAERIRMETEQRSFSPGRASSVSLGVASFRDALSCQRLGELADEALYAAKAMGRNRVVTYGQLKSTSILSGEDPDLISLENKSRVLGERVTNFVTERRRTIIKNLRQEAETDGLTQFFTRRYLDRRLDCQVRNAKSQGELLSIALVDLDHFGNINKQYGWPSGDRTLQALSEKIRKGLRATDWVGRYGGEEFCIVMLDTSLDQAWVACERLRRSVEADVFFATNGESIQVTLSIGIVQCEARDLDMGQLIERVSRQTLAAKHGGRNRICADRTSLSSSSSIRVG